MNTDLPNRLPICALCLFLLLPAGARAAESLAAAQPPAPPAKILLLGMFHFRDGGLDDYKPKHDVDVLSASRQAQVEEIVRCLGAFGPTKVGVEATAEYRDKLRDQFVAYRAGSFDLPANEIYQLGFRFAAQHDLDGVETIDAKGRWYEPFVDPEEWAIANGQAAELIESEGPWEEYYQATYAVDDRAKMERTLREHLLEINREDLLLESHGHYLLGTFKVGRGDEYPGVDVKTAWYNRNLRIFANLLRAIESPEDRLLVIIGAGHVPILRHAVQASPQVELVEVGEYLGEGCVSSP